MREIISGQMIQLGHDKWVRSDAIIAVEPITGRISRTNLSRSRVLIAHAENEILASRTAQTILRDMTIQPSNNSMQEVAENFAEVAKDILDPSKITDVQTCDRALSSQEIDDKYDENLIINHLVESDTVQAAIEASPFGRTKFYQLIKKFGINTKDYKHVTNDADHPGLLGGDDFLIQEKDDGLV